MKIFFTASNNGDGSSSVHFFESKECIDLLEEHDPEGYGGGEGGDWLEVPDGTIVTGITVKNLDWCKEYLKDMGYLDDES